MNNQQKDALIVLFTELGIAFATIAAGVSIIKDANIWISAVAVYIMVISLIYLYVYRTSRRNIEKQSVSAMELMQITPCVKMRGLDINIQFPVINGYVHPIKLNQIRWSIAFVNNDQSDMALDNIDNHPVSRTLIHGKKLIPVGGVELVSFDVRLKHELNNYKIRTLDLIIDITIDNTTHTLTKHFPKEIELKQNKEIYDCDAHVATTSNITTNCV